MQQIPASLLLLLLVACGSAMIGVMILRLLIIDRREPIGRRNPAVGSMLAAPMAYAFMLAVVLGGVVACSTLKKVPAAAKAAGAECLAENKDDLFRLTLDALGQVARWLAAGQQPDWDALADQAEARGTVVATCAVVETWHKIHEQAAPPAGDTAGREPQAVASQNAASKPSAESPTAPGRGRAAIERLRGRIGGGRWTLSDGSEL